MSAYPAIGEPAVTAAAMRVAAGLVEESGLAGLSVTCTGEQISVQVCTWAGDPAQRAAQVARLARLAARAPASTTAGSARSARSRHAGRPAASR